MPQTTTYTIEINVMSVTSQEMHCNDPFGKETAHIKLTYTRNLDEIITNEKVETFIKYVFTPTYNNPLAFGMSQSDSKTNSK